MQSAEIYPQTAHLLYRAMPDAEYLSAALPKEISRLSLKKKTVLRIAYVNRQKSRSETSTEAAGP